jgi:hypothetical protein
MDKPSTTAYPKNTTALIIAIPVAYEAMSYAESGVVSTGVNSIWPILVVVSVLRGTILSQFGAY